MQIIDPTLIPSLISVVVTLAVAAYLFNLWRLQTTRILTDLPLMFSLSFVGTAANMLIHAIPILLGMESTLALFALRSFVIGLGVIPMVGILLHIWFPQFEKWHIRTMLLFVIYWAVVVLISPDETTIILLTVPLLMISILGLIITFAITWKTGRLKEVRSDLLVISLCLGLVTQGLKVPLMNIGLDPLVYLMNVIMMIMVAVALVNPWFKGMKKPSEPIETEMMPVH